MKKGRRVRVHSDLTMVARGGASSHNLTVVMAMADGEGGNMVWWIWLKGGDVRR
jgi:hypothetical protein